MPELNIILSVVKALGIAKLVFSMLLLNSPAIVLVFLIIRKDKQILEATYTPRTEHTLSLQRLDKLQDSVEKLVAALSKVNEQSARFDERFKYLNGVKT